MCNMDALCDVERILKLILNVNKIEVSENEELSSSGWKQLEISESINNGDCVRKQFEKVLKSTELLLEILLNNYETRFNVVIECIFRRIQNLLQISLSSNGLIPFSHVHFYNIIELFVKITVTHPCDSNIKTLNNFYTWNINEINVKRRTECDNYSCVIEELRIHLRIISVVYETIYDSKGCKTQVKQWKEELEKCILVDCNESSLFGELVCKHSEALMIQTLVDVIPKYIKLTDNYEILQFMWENMGGNLDNYSFFSFENSRIFVIFSYLSDFYFVTGNCRMMSNIFSDCVYWISLQNGLMSPDSVFRKQALYLTKASLEYIVQNNISFYCFKNKIDGLQQQVTERCETKIPLIYWKMGMKFDEMKELCTIVEYLEEKQVHIVKPILSTIDKFLNYVEEQKVHVSWALTIIQRMVSHDNTQIIRQGVLNLLKIRLSFYNDEYSLRKGIKLLVTSLNCTQIYMNNLSMLLEELQKYFENCSMQENGEKFFTMLSEEISSIRWSSEALFFMAYSLKGIKSKKYWKIEDINHIKKLITSGTANHYTYIKSGMLCHLLLAAINLIDTHIISLDDIDAFLNCFHRNTSLKRHTLLWEHVVQWISKFYTVEDAKRFISGALGKKNISKMIVILYDSYARDHEFLDNIKHWLTTISATFVGLRERPYSDKQIQKSYLSLICDILSESLGDSEFYNIFRPFISDIFTYIKLELDSIHNITGFESCNFFMSYMNVMLDHDREHLVLAPAAKKLFDEISADLVSKNNFISPIQKFIKLKLLNVITDYIGCDLGIIKSYIREELNLCLIKRSEECDLTADFQTLWGKMNCMYLCGKWQILSKMNGSPAKVLNVTDSEFISLCLEILDLTGHSVLLPLMSAMEKSLPSILNEPRAEKLINAIWKLLMERKKNEEFQRLIDKFVQLLFNLDVIQNESVSVRHMLIEYSRCMLSETTTACVATLLVKQMQKIGFNEEGAYIFEEVLTRSLLFGQISRKDERLIKEVFYLIENSQLSPLMNDVSTSGEVRARSVQILTMLNTKKDTHCRFSENLVESLKLFEEGSSKKKTRYFHDSFVHRVKQRLFQALLVLQPYLTQTGSNKLWHWLSKVILQENNQPSVRYLQEWLIIRLLNRNPNFTDSLWSYFDENLEKRTGSLCSLISIIYHMSKCIPSDDINDFLEKAVHTLLPYCMAQHFTVRLYAQVTLEKMLSTAEKLCSETFTGKYDVVKKSLKQSIDRGNSLKNCEKIQQDFYFTVFDPVKHYSLETIFFHVPRLTNVNPDELISDRLFAKSRTTEEQSLSIPEANSDDSLAKFTSVKWILEESKMESFPVDDSEDTQDFSTSLNFQKKMIPVKCLMPDPRESLESISFSNKKYEKDGLVVVASLIDRIPNLGGLTRTCEVFGATELVIGSLKYTEDKQFQNLSVTAEKWINITEVKPLCLSNYLLMMKRNGYTVLAAEQTINSRPLQHVQFPKKSLVLLGNEKEGIPPNLLPLMDICIEIPQIGVIRSLNVHVTGALFVWEYAKQHIFSGSP